MLKIMLVLLNNNPISNIAKYICGLSYLPFFFFAKKLQQFATKRLKLQKICGKTSHSHIAYGECAIVWAQHFYISEVLHERCLS